MATTLPPLQNPSLSVDNLTRFQNLPTRTYIHNCVQRHQATQYEMTKANESRAQNTATNHTSPKSRFSVLTSAKDEKKQSQSMQKQSGFSSATKQTEHTKKKECSQNSSSESASDQMKEKPSIKAPKNEGVNPLFLDSKTSHMKDNSADEFDTHILDEETHFEIFHNTDASGEVTSTLPRDAESLNEVPYNQDHITKETNDGGLESTSIDSHSMPVKEQSPSAIYHNAAYHTLTAQQDTDLPSKPSRALQTIFGYEALITNDLTEAHQAFDNQALPSSDLGDAPLNVLAFSEAASQTKGFNHPLPQEFQAMGAEFMPNINSSVHFEGDKTVINHSEDSDSTVDFLPDTLSLGKSGKTTQASKVDTAIQTEAVLGIPQKPQDTLRELTKDERITADQKTHLSPEASGSDGFLEQNSADQESFENGEQDGSDTPSLLMKSNSQKNLATQMQNGQAQPAASDFLAEANAEKTGLDIVSDRSSLNTDKSSPSSLSATSSSGSASTMQRLGQTTSLPHSIQNQIAMAIKNNSMNSKTEIKVQLSPISLGKVTIKIDVNSDGHAFVVVASEHAETRDLLQQDSERLANLLSEGDLDVSQDNISYEDFSENGYQESPENNDSQSSPSSDDNAQIISSTVSLSTPEIRINADGTWAAVA